jgi:urease accessory protein
VGGDSLQVDIDVAAYAQVLITTPGAAKVYRSDGRTARQTQRLVVAAHASLEWFPQEAIIFDGACVRMDTRINLATDARYIGWEIVCLGRPACDERYTAGESLFRYQVWRDQRPLLLERLNLPGGAPMLTAYWGMQSLPVFATMLATPVTQAQVQTLRDTIPAPTVTAGVTLIDDLLVCRYLGEDVEQARHYFRQVRDYLRPDIINKPACNPRIWST